MLRVTFYLSFFLMFLAGCSSKSNYINPTIAPITESIYASGTIKGKNQYQAFIPSTGVVKTILVNEGDTVKKGQQLIVLSNNVQQLNKYNAALNVQLNNNQNNQGKLDEAKSNVDFLKSKLAQDSLQYSRQQSLWDKKIGSKVELEQRQLNFENSKLAVKSAIVKYENLKNQLEIAEKQSKNSLQISSSLEDDFILKSEMNGIVYKINKKVGELANPQVALATIGSAKDYVLEMQVDEYDIFNIKLNQKVKVTMDSYRGKVFDAEISKINPLMNENSKTFLIEAIFTQPPPLIYPNITFEANIIVQTKNNAMVVPSSLIVNDSLVKKADGTMAAVKVGLKNYQYAEILSGLSKEDELIAPK